MASHCVKLMVRLFQDIAVFCCARGKFRKVTLVEFDLKSETPLNYGFQAQEYCEDNRRCGLFLAIQIDIDRQSIDYDWVWQKIECIVDLYMPPHKKPR